MAIALAVIFANVSAEAQLIGGSRRGKVSAADYQAVLQELDAERAARAAGDSLNAELTGELTRTSTILETEAHLERLRVNAAPDMTSTEGFVVNGGKFFRPNFTGEGGVFAPGESALIFDGAITAEPTIVPVQTPVTRPRQTFMFNGIQQAQVYERNEPVPGQFTEAYMVRPGAIAP